MRFVLMCQVLDGDSPIQIKWFKDNREISANNIHQADPRRAHSSAREGVDEQFPADSFHAQESQPNGHSMMPNANEPSLAGIELVANEELGASLLFRHVQAKHAGNYTCLATNPFGSSAFSSQMAVKGGLKLHI